jgi:hypothetical protein
MSDKTITTGTEQSLSLQPNGMSAVASEVTPNEKHHKIVRKKIGVCMDHAGASFIGFSNNPTETTAIESSFTHEVKEEALGKSENIMHNKEQQQQKDYYKKICAVLKDYNEVLLFGPTDAKAELANLIKADHHFEKIKIDVKQTDKMTENQQHAFVNHHFSVN